MMHLHSPSYTVVRYAVHSSISTAAKYWLLSAGLSSVHSCPGALAYRHWQGPVLVGVYGHNHIHIQWGMCTCELCPGLGLAGRD